MKIFRLTFPLFGLLLVFANNCDAGLIISFHPSTPDPLFVGSSGTIDVMIHSNTGDVLDAFLVDIAITPIGGPLGGLQFSPSQNDSQLSDLNYVFYGKSLSQTTGTIIGATASPFDTYSGSDFSDDGTGMPFPGLPSPTTLGLTDLLLFRLDLTAFTAGTYSIDLKPSSEFADDMFAPLSFNSTPQTITVNGVAAVPEPGTLGILSLVAAAGVIRRVRRRLQAKAIAPM